MDKRVLIGQLEDQLRAIARGAHDASVAAAEEAARGATAKEKRADARVALENANIAKGQRRRAERAYRELAALDGFRTRNLTRSALIEPGAIVEVEDADGGDGRTFFLAPVGAGMTLTGPGGDGYLTVVTPSSPIGRAVLGHKVGDIIDITVKGDIREYKITWVE